MTEKQLAKQKEREERQREKLKREIERTDSLLVYEKKFEDKGVLCGIDEVGRGPLAGPVMAGAVILPSDHRILYLNDSKKLTAKKREELYDVILSEAVAVGIGAENHDVIDEINILQATYSAMRKAIDALAVRPDFLLVDAVMIPDTGIPECPIIKGDAKSASIAAASIVAKVTRDRMMIRYDEMYPEYHFAKNKGYGTAEHIAAIKKYGPCPIHRKTFIRKFVEESR